MKQLFQLIWKSCLLLSYSPVVQMSHISFVFLRGGGLAACEGVVNPQLTSDQVMRKVFNIPQKFSFFCKSLHENLNEWEWARRLFNWQFMSFFCPYLLLCIKKLCVCVCVYVCSCELHPRESGGASGGERNNLLCVQRPQHQRQRGHVDTQLRKAVSSQPVLPSQPVGKLFVCCWEYFQKWQLTFLCSVESVCVNNLIVSLSQNRWVRSQCVLQRLGCMTCCSVLRSGPSLTARSMSKVSFAAPITEKLNIIQWKSNVDVLKLLEDCVPFCTVFPLQWTKTGKRVAACDGTTMWTKIFPVHRGSLRWSLYLNCQWFSLRVSGASIDINCETNGDIDAMDCSWVNTQWTKPKFKSR